ncbi:VOC family protein [Ramlibacter tataouinensis]|uniref:PhnB protein-like protein n=1 Tax=Ramlibacter tataouinensis (strain ATCC BAA-407 / DSM 14655 / LMG 21543 / TTB310) TaxID=365046 RepID=F5Y503_RAMTT|nr:VOC family protein [Ramlibacter tataouinensis]AEG93843.1 PhnB protein-like protein [Ramlibacter tataouinensis TTB310]
MPQLDSYLFFNGNCADAMRFYERTLGAQLETMMTFGQSPDPMPGTNERNKHLIMHASLLLDGRRLMASDLPPGMPHQPMAGFSVSLNYATAPEARKTFDALAEGGQVTMPFGKTFWADGFGMLTDRFGTPWMVGSLQSPAL